MSEEARQEVTPEVAEAETPEVTAKLETVEEPEGAPEVPSEANETEDPTAFWREQKRKADREAKNLRERLQKFEAQEEERKREAMNEAERLQADLKKAAEASTQNQQRAEAAEAKLREVLVRSEATTRAIAAGAKPERIEAVLRLTDLSDTITDDGEPDGKAIETALKATLKSYPEFRKTQPNIGDGSNPGTSPPDANENSWQMSPEKFAEIQRRVAWGDRIVPS